MSDMSENVRTVQLFEDSAGQAVHIPDDMRFGGGEVRIRRCGDGLLIEPSLPQQSLEDWLRDLKAYDGPV